MTVNDFFKSASTIIAPNESFTRPSLHRVSRGACVCVCVRAWSPSSAPSHPRRSDLGVVEGVLPIEDLGVASALSAVARALFTMAGLLPDSLAFSLYLPGPLRSH